jgi:uncharacterized protein
MLYCYPTNTNGLLSFLDIRANTSLQWLYCDDNQLTTLDVSTNTALWQLYCNNNQLTTLDVSTNTALRRLSCNNNQLTTLDVSTNTALQQLYCNDNQLTTLDVSTNSALQQLSCNNNQLTTLNVSNTALLWLSCCSNQLTSLDISTNTALSVLICDDNQLNSLGVSTNTALQQLHCNNNQLTTLNVSYNTDLRYLFCAGNQLTTLDVSYNTGLRQLSCENNQINTLDLSHNLALSYLSCYEDNSMTIILDTWQNIPTVYYYSSLTQVIREPLPEPMPYTVIEPEAIDLGLSVKWASFNLGATVPEEYGDYFAWGETQPYYEQGSGNFFWPIWKQGITTGYDWPSYRFNPSGDGQTFTKYTGSDYDTLQPEDDAATANLGGSWRMPTFDECCELTNTNNCDWVWTNNYNSTGIKGYVVTSKIEGYTGNSIFLPAAGGRAAHVRLSDNGYWSSSVSISLGCSWFINSTSVQSAGRRNGFPVRPVTE